MSEATEPLIDWGLAARVARGIAGDGRQRTLAEGDLRRAARGSVGLVRDYTGLEPQGRLPRPELVGRPEWIEANLVAMRELAAPAEERLASGTGAPPPLDGLLRGAAGKAAGVEVGVASGYLAQHVLGQYDVALIGPQRPPRLLFVAPNLVEAERKLGAERRAFLRWVALHESTHVVQFSSVPWLREHLGSLAQKLLAGAFADVDARELVRLARHFAADPRRLIATVREGDWMSPFMDAGQQRRLRRLQATMSLIEGYSEHVMDAIGDRLGPQFSDLRERMERRRADRGWLEALVSRLLGLEMKLRQYRLGKAFCDEVVERRGIATLNRAWDEPGAMPRPSELERPGRWLARVA